MQRLGPVLKAVYRESMSSPAAPAVAGGVSGGRRMTGEDFGVEEDGPSEEELEAWVRGMKGACIPLR